MMARRRTQGITYPDGGKYVGGMVDGLREGFGRLDYEGNLAFYEGHWQQDVFHGKGKMVYQDGSSYEGDFHHGLRQGHGVLVKKDGGRYKGDWLRGKFDGRGEYRYASGDVYTGDWREGKKEGEGEAIYISGASYKGEWKADRRHGYFGTYIHSNGDVYKGSFYLGKAHGSGKMRYNNGTVYSGEFREGRRQGQGSLTWTDGAIFEGAFVKDRAKRGVYTKTNKQRMRGTFQRDTRNYERDVFVYDESLHNMGLEGRLPYTIARGRWGKVEQTASTYEPSDGTFRGLTDEEQEIIEEFRDGEYVEEAHLLSTEERKMIDRMRDPANRVFPPNGIVRYFDGTQYEGDFKVNKENPREHIFEGSGTMWLTDGRVYIGEWANNMKEGKGSFQREHGGYYEGEFVNDKMHGFGIYWLQGGCTYTGYWKCEKMHGFGVMTYQDGSIYEGQFQNDRKHGWGTLYYTGGSIYKGEWRKGNIHGRGELKSPPISLERPLQTTSSGNYAANPNWPLVVDPTKPVLTFGATEMLDPFTHELKSAIVSIDDIPDPRFIFKGKFTRDQRDNYAQRVFNERLEQDLLDAQRDTEMKRQAAEKEVQDMMAQFKGLNLDIETIRKLGEQVEV